VANGRHAGQDFPKDTDPSDSAGLSVCNFAIDWFADVYSNASGYLPGLQAGLKRKSKAPDPTGTERKGDILLCSSAT
jgi:hypothetical protein